MLMQPETFAEQSPCAAALGRAADFFARDHAQFWRGAGGQFIPIGDQATLREPFALLPDAGEIAALREPRVTAKSQACRAGAWRRRAFRRLGGHGIRPASSVCGPGDGDWRARRVRPWWNCG